MPLIFPHPLPSLGILLSPGLGKSGKSWRPPAGMGEGGWKGWLPARTSYSGHGHTKKRGSATLAGLPGVTTYTFEACVAYTHRHLTQTHNKVPH